ncbi:MAG TPA: hypothetical protein VIN03_12080 [Roseateles sp.]
MSLPSSWTDRIFAKLTVTYGQRFLGLYSGVDLQAVKDDWGHELRGYAQAPKAIAHALDSLPVDKPPTVLEFRQLCRGAPQYVDTARLPAPKPNMAVAAEALKGVNVQAYDPKEWAKSLKDREANGANLTKAQRWMWREALGENKGAS